MTSGNHATFYKHMADHYRTQRNLAESKYGHAFTIALDLLQAINDSESDGSGINDLKSVAKSKHAELLLVVQAE